MTTTTTIEEVLCTIHPNWHQRRVDCLNPTDARVTETRTATAGDDNCAYIYRKAELMRCGSTPQQSLPQQGG